VLALVIFGPKRLPDLGKNLGKAISGFKKGMTEAAEEFKSEIDDSKKMP
jgi:sec-independent protein translocase protein TatA